MYKRFINIFLSGVIIFSVYSCEPDPAFDEPTETLSKMFTPVDVKEESVIGNKVTYSWFPINGAKYQIDISRDVNFTPVDFHHEISGVYIFTFEGLLSLTDYYGRIKSVSIDNSLKDSEYKIFTFRTGQENIFFAPRPADIGVGNILMRWDYLQTVTHLKVSHTIGDVTIEDVVIDISNVVTAGEYNVTGLNSNTEYLFEIFSGEIRRGVLTEKTATP